MSKDTLSGMLDQYLALEQEIHKYFGYQEDWVVIPIDDRREYYWLLKDEDTGEVWYSKERSNLEAMADHYKEEGDLYWDVPGVDGTNIYSDEIYTQRFLPKWVYKGVEYTLICVDTRTDGNKFLAIYSNDKRVPLEG